MSTPTIPFDACIDDDKPRAPRVRGVDPPAALREDEDAAGAYRNANPNNRTEYPILKSGAVVDAKNTLASQSIVATDVTSTEWFTSSETTPSIPTLQSGEPIDAKNTVRFHPHPAGIGTGTSQRGTATLSNNIKQTSVASSSSPKTRSTRSDLPIVKVSASSYVAAPIVAQQVPLQPPDVLVMANVHVTDNQDQINGLFPGQQAYVDVTANQTGANGTESAPRTKESTFSLRCLLVVLISVLVAIGAVAAFCGTGGCLSRDNASSQLASGSLRGNNGSTTAPIVANVTLVSPSVSPTTSASPSVSPTASLSPSVSPSSAAQARAYEILAFIKNITLTSHVKSLADPPNANSTNLSIEERALQWLIELDPLQLTPDTATNQFRLHSVSKDSRFNRGQEWWKLLGLCKRGGRQVVLTNVSGTGYNVPRVTVGNKSLRSIFPTKT
jgi:hypothetical protein